LVLATLLMVGLVAVPATAGDQLPFKAKAMLVDEYALGPPGPCGTFPFAVGTVTTYQGTATHLGRFELTEFRCNDVFTYADRIPFEIYATFMTANGDELYYFVDATVVFPPVGPPVIEGGGFDWTGGTGRFASVSGVDGMPDGFSEVIFDDSGSVIALRQYGVISYDASDRAG
jgi:hypothetical protein